MWSIVLTHPVTLAQTSPAIIKLVDWHPQVDVLAVVLDTDGVVTTHGPDEIWLYNSQGEPLVELMLPEALRLTVIHWSPDGQRLVAVGERVDNADFRLYMWNTIQLDEPLLITTFEPRHPWAQGVTFASNLLITTYFDEVVIWDIGLNQEVRRIDTEESPDYIKRVERHPLTQWLVGVTSESVYVWDTSQDYTLVTFLATEPGINDIIWSPQGDKLAIAINNRIEIWAWDVSQAQFQYETTLVGHSLRIAKLEWRSEILVSKGFDDKIFVWNMAHNGQLITNLDTLSSDQTLLAYQVMALSPDGQQVFYLGIDGAFTIYTITTDITPDTLRAEVAACGLPFGLQTSLNAKIAAEQWPAFINEVTAQYAKRIPAACADILLEQAIFLRDTPSE